MKTSLPTGTTVELVAPGTASRGVVVLPDVLGLRPLFEEMAARLSDEHGWAVAVPEPYPGQEDVPVEVRLAGMAGFDAARQVADCHAAAELLGVGSVAVLGFCLGGTGAFRAAVDARYDRVVACYGMVRLPDPWRTDGATDPIDDLASFPSAAVKVLALAGTEDPYVPEGHLDELGPMGVTVVRYPGAGHQFVHDPDAPSHRPQDAADAWSRAVSWISA